jgi:hypothetical protein
LQGSTKRIELAVIRLKFDLGCKFHFKYGNYSTDVLSRQMLKQEVKSLFPPTPKGRGFPEAIIL